MQKKKMPIHPCLNFRRGLLGNLINSFVSFTSLKFLFLIKISYLFKNFNTLIFRETLSIVLLFVYYGIPFDIYTHAKH